MKIKNDFVTNSSSCSYILNMQCTGSVDSKLISGDNYDEIKYNTNETLSKVSTDLGKCLYYRGFISREFFIKNNHPSFDDPNQRTKFVLSLKTYNDFAGGGSPENIIIKTCFALTANPRLNLEGEPAHELFKEIFSKIIKAYEIDLKMESYPFLAIPEPTGDGGWDGGDPMGKYAMTYELLEHETKVGHIYVIDNKVRFDVKKLGESHSLMMDLRDKILYGQNPNSKLVVDP